MCGCSGGIADGSSLVAPAYQVTSSNRTLVDCPYTKEQAASWLVTVNCVKDNGYYVDMPNVTKFQLNLYIGVLISVGNYTGSPCYFAKELDEIDAFITTVNSMNLCQ
jgi:hypothetical protein